MDTNVYSFDILFLGESQVGKTAFIQCYTVPNYAFTDKMLATFINGK